jgi:hypothetical protein
MATSTPRKSSVARKVIRLDAEDASRLSFLTYAVKHYGQTNDVKGMINALKTTDAKDIAAVIFGGRPKNERVKEVAKVYQEWIEQNS